MSPSETIVVNRDPQNHDHDDLGVALRDAFAAAQRQLRAYSKKRNAAAPPWIPLSIESVRGSDVNYYDYGKSNSS